MNTEFTPAAARASHCWFKVDRVPGDDATTAWKRAARFRQARWRETRKLEIGSSPYAGGKDATPVGSRLELDFARKSGANFLSPAALAAARHRVANPEPHQMLATDRLWADLLSSMPLCFNLFGDLAADRERASHAVRSWWPDAPRGEVSVRFEHSPARKDRAYLGNRSAFDVAFDLDAGSARAIVGVETKYHEHAKAEKTPRPAALKRYVEIAERSGAFADGWQARVVETELQQIWLDHLLLLSMLQHPLKRWWWGRFVLVYPSRNPSFAAAASSYREVLRDPATFAAVTIEELVATPGALTAPTAAAFRERYLG